MSHSTETIARLELENRTLKEEATGAAGRIATLESALAAATAATDAERARVQRLVAANERLRDARQSSSTSFSSVPSGDAPSSGPSSPWSSLLGAVVEELGRRAATPEPALAPAPAVTPGLFFRTLKDVRDPADVRAAAVGVATRSRECVQAVRGTERPPPTRRPPFHIASCSLSLRVPGSSSRPRSAGLRSQLPMRDPRPPSTPTRCGAARAANGALGLRRLPHRLPSFPRHGIATLFAHSHTHVSGRPTLRSCCPAAPCWRTRQWTASRSCTLRVARGTRKPSRRCCEPARI